MSNLHDLQEMVIEMTSYLHHVVQPKHKNRQRMEAKDICFCGESFSNRSFLVLEILREGIYAPPPPPPPPMATRAKKAHVE